MQTEIIRRLAPIPQAKPQTTPTFRKDLAGRIVGYASVFWDPSNPGTQYRVSDDLVERIGRDAFSDIGKDDVWGLFNHDTNYPLGRTGNGTVRLSVDDRGLRYEIDMPNTQLARDTLELVRRGDLFGSSFAAILRLDNTGISYTKEAGKTVRTIKKVHQLVDVSIVTIPAFPAASTGLADSKVDPSWNDRQRTIENAESFERERFLRDAEQTLEQYRRRS